MEFAKQNGQNQIQNNFSKKLKEGIFKVGVCLSLLLGFAGKSFAGFKEAQNYAVKGLTDLSKDPTSGLSTCSPGSFVALIYVFHAALVRLDNHTAPSGNLLLEQFTYGYGGVMGIKEVLRDSCAIAYEDQNIAELQQLFSRMVFAFLLADGNTEAAQAPSPIDGGQDPASSSARTESVFQPSVTRVDNVFQPSVTRVDSVVQSSVTSVDSVFQPSVTRVDSVVQPSVTRVDSVFQPSVTRVDSVVQPSVTRVDNVFHPSVTRTGNVFLPSSIGSRVGRVVQGKIPQASASSVFVPSTPEIDEENVEVRQ